MPAASRAVTVKLWEVPAVVGDVKPETVKLAPPAGLTVMLLWPPVMVAVTVSVAVMLCEPTVFKVALVL